MQAQAAGGRQPRAWDGWQVCPCRWAIHQRRRGWCVVTHGGKLWHTGVRAHCQALKQGTRCYHMAPANIELARGHQWHPTPIPRRHSQSMDNGHKHTPAAVVPRLAFARPGHTTSHVTNGAWWAIMECTPPQRRGPRVTEKRPNTALGAGALEHVCSARTVKMTAAQFQHKYHGNTTLSCQLSLTQFPKWIQQIHSQISKPRFARKIPTQVGPCFPRSSNLTELAVQ